MRAQTVAFLAVLGPISDRLRSARNRHSPTSAIGKPESMNCLQLDAAL